MFLTRLAACLLTLALVSCGGGGGSGSSSSGGSGSDRFFTLSATSASVRATRFSPFDPARVTLRVTNSRVAALGAAFPAGQSVSWLQVDIQGSGSNYTVTLNPIPSGMPIGTSTVNVLVGATDASGSVLQSETVRVTVEIIDGIHFVPPLQDLAAVFGVEDSLSASLPLVNNGRTYNLTTDVPWITLPAGAQSSGSVVASMDTTTLSVGGHTASITARNPNDAADWHTAMIFLTLQEPQLTVSPTTVYIGGEDGIQPLTSNVSVSLGTGARPWPWTAALQNLSIASAMSFPAASGTVSGTSPATVTINGDLAQIPSGSYAGKLLVQATVRNVVFSRQVDVVVNREAQRLFPDTDGIAFSSFPGRSVLSRQVVVSHSSGRANVPWAASASQPWLHVTPSSGVSGATITISATPAALAANQFYEATLTLTSTDVRIDRPETIRVGLWKGSSNTVDISLPWPESPYIRLMQVNPVEPWIYLLLSDGTIAVYHAHTGAHLTDFATGVNQYSTFSVSGNGRRLYVADQNESTPRVLELDAATGALLRTFPAPVGTSMASDNRHGIIVATRMNGHDVLWQPYTGLGVGPIDLDTGQLLPQYNQAGSQFFTNDVWQATTGQMPSPDGQFMYVSTYSSINVSRRNFSMLHGPSLVYVPGTYYARGPDVTDFCVAKDGKLYHASQFDYRLQLYAQNLGDTTPVQITLPAPSFGITCNWDGRKYVSLLAQAIGDPNVFVADVNGATVALFRKGPSTSAMISPLKISGDGRRMAWMYSPDVGGIQLWVADTPP